jgi:DNA-binding MarR family transcriptional regulator
MMVLWENETVSSRELARCLHLDYGTLTPVLRRLQQAGLITKERSSDDERTLTLTLTGKGRGLRNSAVSIPSAVAEITGLSAEEFRTLYTIAYKALDHMENNSKGER